LEVGSRAPNPTLLNLTLMRQEPLIWPRKSKGGWQSLVRGSRRDVKDNGLTIIIAGSFS